MNQVICAKNIGFCMGVQKAFTKALECGTNLQNVCCYGEIVHNRFALQELSDKNITIKESLDQIINDTNIKNVIIRAHGIPRIDEQKLLQSKNVIDLTCPIVKQVQKLAQQLTNQNYQIVILGKINHPEVIGICGYCHKNFIVVKNIEELKSNLKNISKNEKIAFISQTTANINDFNEISDFLQNDYENVKIFNTLCNSPRKIQDDAINLAKNVDLMIIIGDKQSANTTTLFNLCKKENQNCIFAETPKDLINIKIQKKFVIGLAAGTSTPNSQIEEIKQYIKNINN